MLVQNQNCPKNFGQKKKNSGPKNFGPTKFWFKNLFILMVTGCNASTCAKIGGVRTFQQCFMTFAKFSRPLVPVLINNILILTNCSDQDE